MAMITRFEDIQAWQEARKLVKMIYKLTGSGMLAKDFGFRDQIQRASVSSTLAPDAHLPDLLRKSYGSPALVRLKPHGARECRCGQYRRRI